MTVRSRKEQLALAAVFVLLALQVVAVGFVSAPWMTGDTPVYLQLADGLRLGQYGLAANGYAPDVLRPPAYPLLLASILGLTGLGPAWMIAIQLILYLAAIYAVVRLAANWGVPPLLLAAIAVAYPFCVGYAARLGVEGWLIPAYTLFAVLVSSRPTIARLLAAGFLSGFLILLRSDMLLVPVVGAALVVLFRVNGRAGFKPAVRDTAVLLAAAALTILPYCSWNLLNHGRFQPTPLAAAVGSSLYTASWQQRVSHEDMNAIYEGRPTKAAIEAGLVAEIREVNHSIGAPLMSAPFNPVGYATPELQMAANRAFGAAGMDRILANPSMYARHVIENLWELWNTANYPAGLPTAAALGLMLVSALVTILGYAGIAIAVVGFRTQPFIARAALLALYPLAVHLPLHTEARYTAAARPLLMLFAALALWHLFTFLRQRVERQAI